MLCFYLGLCGFSGFLGRKIQHETNEKTWGRNYEVPAPRICSDEPCRLIMPQGQHPTAGGPKLLIEAKCMTTSRKSS